MTIEEALKNPLAITELPRNNWAFLPHLKEFTNLEKLTISGYDFDAPDNFDRFEKLTHVHFREFNGHNKVSFNEMLHKLKPFPNLNSIDFSQNRYLTQIPDFTDLDSITSINLGYNHQITNIRNGLKQLAQQVPNLTYLNLRTMKLKFFPTEIFQFKKLQILDLTHNQFEEIPEEITELPDFKQLILGNRSCFPDTKELMKVVTYFPQFAELERKMALSFSLNDGKDWANPDYVNSFINLLNHPIATIRIKALNQLEKLNINAFQSSPLTPQSRLAFAGKTHGQLREIKGKLKALSIPIDSKVNEKTTHILIGEKPAKKTESLLNSTAIFLTETQLNNFLIEENQLYLVEKDNPDIGQNLQDLLNSPDPVNQDLAINMMKSGGVAPNLIPDLFLIYQYPNDAKQKKEAADLLKRFASKELREKLARPYYFGKKRGTELVKRIQSVCENTELDMAETSYAIFKKTGYNREYLLENGDAKIRLEVLKSLMNQSDKLRLTVPIKEVINELVQIENLRELAIVQSKTPSFPQEIAQLRHLKSLELSFQELINIPDDFTHFPKLESLKLFNCNLSKLPIVITTISSLKTLDLTSNRLKELPEEIANLTELEELNIGWNGFKSFPKILLELPKLTRVKMYNSMAVMTPKQWLSM